jgi:hypothetical protein
MTTNPNQTGKDAKNLGTPQDESAPKAAKPSESARELTDAEIAAVAGGLNVKRQPPPMLPQGG